jgi:hypothetical protein
MFTFWSMQCWPEMTFICKVVIYKCQNYLKYHIWPASHMWPVNCIIWVASTFECNKEVTVVLRALWFIFLPILTHFHNLCSMFTFDQCNVDPKWPLYAKLFIVCKDPVLRIYGLYLINRNDNKYNTYLKKNFGIAWSWNTIWKGE